MRTLLLLFGVPGLLLAALLWWLKFEHGTPSVTFDPDVSTVGRDVMWKIGVDASGSPGLREVVITIDSGGKTIELLRQGYPAGSFLGGGVPAATLVVAGDLTERGVAEGPGRVAVAVDTYAWHIIPRRGGFVTERAVTLDLTPPNAQLLTTQHNIRLGGAALALVRVPAEAKRAEVRVGEYTFPMVRGYFEDPEVAVALFAVPQDLAPNIRPIVQVADAVGNARDVVLPCTIHPREFRKSKLEINDAFLQRKVPELYAVAGQPPPADLVQGYLFINRDMRMDSERRIDEVTAKSNPKPLWDGAFHRQSNSAPMSSFADRREYVHQGETIDRQIHLGFDLASLRAAPVEATQNGIVVFAEMLGIYGNTVILDHGFGVFSLYGHLSTFAVKVGDHVSTGQTVGQTGDTGLAGGDHLHFSILLRGVHIDPVEWWDPKWLKDHVTDPLKMFPVVGEAAAPAVAPAAPVATPAPTPAAPEGANAEARP